MATRRIPPTDPDDGDEGLTDQTAMALHRAAARAQETDGEESAIADRVRDLVAQTPGDRVRLKLYRRDLKSSTMQWCDDYSPEEFESGDLAMIRDAWGAGLYELRIIGSTGIKGRVQISIAPKPESAVAVTRSDPMAGELGRVMQTLADSQAAILQALSQRPDPMAQMQQTIALMATMREAMGLNTPPAIAAPPAPQTIQSSMMELIGALRAVRELSGEISPPADGENPMAMLGQILEVVKVAKQAEVSRPQLPPPTALHGARTPAPRPPVAPVPRPQTPTAPTAPKPAQAVSLPDTIAAAPNVAPIQAPQPAQEPAPMNAEQQMISELRAALRNLVRLAATGQNPDAGGDLIYEQLPDDFLPYLNLPNWFDLVAQFEPAIIPHRAWMEAAKASADELFNAPDDEGGADDIGDAPLDGDGPPTADESVTIPGPAI